MATRQMYLSHPGEFLLWYFKRFASYRHIKPNSVHRWLSNKKLLTQNIDGLDGKAGNPDYIPIHGRLDKVTVLHEQGLDVPLINAPWEQLRWRVLAIPSIVSGQPNSLALIDRQKIVSIQSLTVTLESNF